LSHTRVESHQKRRDSEKEGHIESRRNGNTDLENTSGQENGPSRRSATRSIVGVEILAPQMLKVTRKARGHSRPGGKLPKIVAG